MATFFLGRQRPFLFSHEWHEGVIWDRDAKYFYYDHGPLARVEIGENDVQGIDYAYTLQAWLKGINSNALDPLLDMGQDGHDDGMMSNPNMHFAHNAYGMSLGYFTHDYRPINAADKWTQANRFEAKVIDSDLYAERHHLYNGNIGHMVSSSLNPTTHTPEPIANAYTYDQLHRLAHSKSFTNFDQAANEWQQGSIYEGMYENSFTSWAERSRRYDANGNIETQLRKDAEGNEIDELTYHYHEGTYGRLRNRLYHVNDAVGDTDYDDDIDDQGPFVGDLSQMNTANNYGYDPLGQLIRDDQEGITAITWRNDGKIRDIFRANDVAEPRKELSFDYSPYDRKGGRYESPPAPSFQQYYQQYFKELNDGVKLKVWTGSATWCMDRV